eukprot:scaffold798_cov79-Cylindrotheca_fusiformis.AAC.6
MSFTVHDPFGSILVTIQDVLAINPATKESKKKIHIPGQWLNPVLQRYIRRTLGESTSCPSTPRRLRMEIQWRRWLPRM